MTEDFKKGLATGLAIGGANSGGNNGSSTGSGCTVISIPYDVTMVLCDIVNYEILE